MAGRGHARLVEVNFLLHRSFAGREVGSAHAGVGAMLPDLWRLADRRVRPLALPPPAAGDLALDQILSGVAHHLALDDWFHRSATFTEGERRTAERLVAASPATPRLGLFAHLAWELCLDGALLLRQGRDGLLAGLRRDVAASTELLDQAVERAHFRRKRADPEARALFAARMANLIRELLAGTWISAYMTGPGLVEVLDRIRRRLALPELSPLERRSLQWAFDELLDEASAALAELEAARAANPP